MRIAVLIVAAVLLSFCLFCPIQALDDHHVIQTLQWGPAPPLLSTFDNRKLFPVTFRFVEVLSISATAPA
jgi:hypothetical protein